MATVFFAHDLRHDRPVALKLLHPDLSYALGAERFQREIKLAARLQHPHILTVFDSGHADGQFWYTMPFVAGETLRDRLTRQHQLAVPDAVRLTQDVAHALDYAHRQGVIHRDIKPENILISEGKALLADFGIGRRIGEDESERLTGTGLSVGTAAYMSPEQATAERDLDGRTDIYSLAVVLYELLAGEPPFTGPSLAAIIARSLTERPRPIRPIRDAVPEALDAAIAKAMATTRADRYPTAAAFADALTAALSSSAVSSAVVSSVVPSVVPSVAPTVASTVTSATPKGRSRRRVLLAGAATALGLGIAFMLLWPRSAASDGPTRIAVLPFENLGDSADQYFADGMTDAIRVKLTSVAGMEVIARESSNEYRKTSMTREAIGAELGVRYLLTGTIRFDQNAGSRRVQVSPELIEVSKAAAKWSKVMEAPVTDVFKVQGDIAGEVSRALDIALGDKERDALYSGSTASLEAYDALLRGDRAWDWPSNSGSGGTREALSHYHTAIRLDSTFATAYSRISTAYSVSSARDGTLRVLADSARSMAERGVELAPNAPETRAALGFFYRHVRNDNRRALEEYARISPAGIASNEIIMRSVGAANLALGHWELGLQQLRQAQALNHRSPGAARGLSHWLTWMRQYPEATLWTDRALALNSLLDEVHNWRIAASVSRGDLTSARGAFAVGATVLGPEGLFRMPSFVYSHWYHVWILLPADQERWLAATMESGRRARPPIEDRVADYHLQRGDASLARRYADSALVLLSAQLADVPTDAFLRMRLALMLAIVGRNSDAVAEGLQAASLLPISAESERGVILQHQLVRVYLLTGDPERALDHLEPLLAIPGYLSPAWLRADPGFASLKGNPRFEKLITAR